ncbi:hypothetical protein NDU88_006000 [Pleurodeles waltl]|uniref:Uncharacterized protein n=1 Tax=Pleurodeles waltl TaxID=8319 RepID=A0AAV7LQP3_PLEWA|nr:hypothetical protein NDU88_006000 [Pleurodeles waltl]
MRSVHNGGAVSSGVGGRNGAKQRQQEEEEEADDGTDISASGEAWQSQLRAGSRERGTRGAGGQEEKGTKPKREWEDGRRRK